MTATDFELTATAVSRLWPVFVTSILVVAWFIRLESRQFFYEKDFERYRNESRENERKMWENIEKIEDQNTKILQSLSRLEGKIDQL